MGREVKLEEEEMTTKTGLKVLKDKNFLALGEKLNIYKHLKKEVLEILEKDAVFLATNKLMDYSLLFIKVLIPKEKGPALRRMPALIFMKEKR